MASPSPGNQNTDRSALDRVIFLDPFSIEIIKDQFLSETSNFGAIPRAKLEMLKQKVIHARKQNKFLAVDLDLLKSNQFLGTQNLKGQVGISQIAVITDLIAFDKKNIKIKSTRGCWNSLSYKIHDQVLAFDLFPLGWRLVFLELLRDPKITHIKLSTVAIQDPVKYKDLAATSVFQGITEAKYFSINE